MKKVVENVLKLYHYLLQFLQLLRMLCFATATRKI